ncbi:MAG TPA: hypothetical protein VHH88_08385, partial [Verrucomicrobiae bacterium]|nr:hypothetical protein [Verrucomicrobiae bacterium]
MKRFFPALLAIFSLILVSTPRARGADGGSVAARWLAHAQTAPPFRCPTTLTAWQGRRQSIRAEAVALLGKLPPRPKLPAVRTLWRKDRGDYFLEKFE